MAGKRGHSQRLFPNTAEISHLCIVTCSRYREVVVYRLRENKVRDRSKTVRCNQLDRRTVDIEVKYELVA